jgi:rhodanese-related sulfurtransferase
MKTAGIVVALAIAIIALFLLRPKPDIDEASAKKLVDGGATLVDVRSPAEFSSGHVDGAVNIPVDSISGRLDELPRDEPVVLYCRSGARSARAAEILRNNGFESVHNVGPMPRW